MSATDNILEIEVTGGEWIVTPTQSDIPGHLTIRRADTHEPIAVFPPQGTKPNWSDAALMCASKQLLNAICEIHQLVNESKETFSIERINEAISRAAEKVNAEIIA